MWGEKGNSTRARLDSRGTRPGLGRGKRRGHATYVRYYLVQCLIIIPLHLAINMIELFILVLVNFIIYLFQNLIGQLPNFSTVTCVGVPDLSYWFPIDMFHFYIPYRDENGRKRVTP